MTPAATLGESLESFFDAVDAFFENLAAIHWGTLLLGLLFHGGYLTIRTRGWFNALQAAYPAESFRWRDVWAAYVTGMGINSVIPARAGDVAKLYLTKHSIPGSSYPAVASSLIVDVLFESVLAVLLVLYALSQGVLPDLPSLPAVDLGYLAQHPRFTLFLVTFLAAASLVAIAILSARVRGFWARVRQGVVVLRDRDRYLRHVVAWQALAWCSRFVAFWLLLDAFGIGGSVRNVLLVMAVQSLATLVPFTPGGAGAQQALLAVIFAGVAAGAQVAAYSVGQQISIAAFNVALGFAGLALVFGTTDWRSLVSRGRAERTGAA